MQIYKAAKYIRLSYTDDKSNESDSVGNQRKLIEEFASHHPEIELVSERVDDGYSGVIFDRPAFKEMMDDIMEGKINCVIVKDLSRLGREYIETGRYMRRVFPAYGVRFIAINDNIDTINESAGDDLTVSVKNIMNEAYARDISLKTRSSLETKRKNGDFVGAFTVYGYRKSEENHNLLVVDEYAAQVVRSIFRMRLEGFSPYAIANELNRLGTLSPLAYKKMNGLPCARNGYTDRKDCRWSSTTIVRILQPCYGMTIRESELESIVYEFLCKQFEVSLGIDGPNELKPVDKVAVRRAEFDNQIFELQEEKRKLYEALVIKQIDVNLYKEQKALIEQRLLEVQNTKAVVMTRLEAEQQEKERQHQQKDVLQSLVENKGLTSELVDMLIEKIFIYPNKRVEIVLKIKNDLA